MGKLGLAGCVKRWPGLLSIGAVTTSASHLPNQGHLNIHVLKKLFLPLSTTRDPKSKVKDIDQGLALGFGEKPGLLTTLHMTYSECGVLERMLPSKSNHQVLPSLCHLLVM